MHARAHQRALLVLAAMTTTTPAFLAGVVVQDQDKFGEVVEMA